MGLRKSLPLPSFLPRLFLSFPTEFRIMPLNAKWFSTRGEFLLPSAPPQTAPSAARDPITTNVIRPQASAITITYLCLSLSPLSLSCDVPNRPSVLFFIIRHTSKLPELATRSVTWSVPLSVRSPSVRWWRCSLIIYNSHSTTAAAAETKLPKGSPRGLPAIAERPTTIGQQASGDSTLILEQLQILLLRRRRCSTVWSVWEAIQ